MYSLSAASGNTTEPMSRPSITPPPRSSAHSRWRARSSARTGVLAATALDGLGDLAAADRGVASTPSTSTPPSSTDELERPGQLGDGRRRR